MREIVFKHLISDDHRSHHVSVIEEVEEDGMLARSVRASHYVLKTRITRDKLSPDSTLRAVLEQPKPNLDSLCITKTHNSQKHQNTYRYKANGYFYLLTKGELLVFDFIETFTLKFTDKATMPQASRITREDDDD